MGDEHWTRPELVVEVDFADWTPDERIRHAVYQGVREDKPPREVTREPMLDAAPPRAVSPNRVGAVKVSNPERVIDPSSGLKKLDLVRYYESVADRMLPHLADRPVSLVRGPTGVTGELFFQKHDDKQSIPGLRELDPALWAGHPALLEVPGFTAWLKTSGGKGLHVVVPITPKLDYDNVKAFSQAIVQHLAATVPSRFVAKSGAGNRVGKIFVDYLRNGHGATTAAAFSARARPGLGVSMPVSWDQLMSLKSGAQWTISTAREYLSFQKDDPWSAYWSSRQTLTAAMKKLGYTPSAKANA